MFSGRNRETREVKHEEHEETLEELHENGVHAVPLKSKNEFNAFLEDHEMTFINYYAPWCMWWYVLYYTFLLFHPILFIFKIRILHLFSLKVNVYTPHGRNWPRN